MEELFKKKAAKYKVKWGQRLTSTWSRIAHHQYSGHYSKIHIDARLYDMSQEHIMHWFWPIEMDYAVMIKSWISYIQYGIQAVSQVWAIYDLDPRFQKPEVKTLKRAPMSQRRVYIGFGEVIQHNLGWLWTWWMVQDHFSFILYWLYIILCFKKHIPR